MDYAWAHGPATDRRRNATAAEQGQGAGDWGILQVQAMM
jgi:hypothetical protein